MLTLKWEDFKSFVVIYEFKMRERDLGLNRVHSFDPDFLVNERIQLARKNLDEAIPLEIKVRELTPANLSQGSVILLEGNLPAAALVLDNSGKLATDYPHIPLLIYSSDGSIYFERFESSILADLQGSEVSIVNRYSFFDGLDFNEDFAKMRNFSFDQQADYISTQLANVQFLLKLYGLQEVANVNSLRFDLYLDPEGRITEERSGAVAEFELGLKPQLPIGFNPFILQKFEYLGGYEFSIDALEQDLETVFVLANYIQPALVYRDLNQLNSFAPAPTFTLEAPALFKLSNSMQLAISRRAFQARNLKQYTLEDALQIDELKFQRLVVESNRPTEDYPIALCLDLIIAEESYSSSKRSEGLQTISEKSEGELRELVGSILRLVDDPAFDISLDRTAFRAQVSDFGLSISCYF